MLLLTGSMAYQYQPLGDHGVLVKFDEQSTLRHIIPLLKHFDIKPPFIDIIPTLESLYINYDADMINYHDIVSLSNTILTNLLESEESSQYQPSYIKVYDVPLYYYGDIQDPYYQDVNFLCDTLQLSHADFIHEHHQQLCDVLMIGFQPGFLYSGYLNEKWDIPRATKMKTNVPAGTVSIAIRQNVMSTIPAPTGWHIIGKTPFINFSLHHDPIITINAGDKIRFYPIHHHDFITLQQRFENGETIIHYKQVAINTLFNIHDTN